LDLNDRKKLILKASVDTYIEKCEPIGSKYLVDYYNIGLSPATIRNTMNELEQLGLLEQPYTSAGRIPSSLGYRVYVDNLMQSYRLTSNEIKEIREINEHLNIKISSLDKIIEQAAKLMSVLTSLMSVSMTPKIISVKIIKFEILYIDSNNFLLVIITSVNIAKTKHVYNKTEMSPEVLARLSTILNDNLVNIDISTVSLPLILDIEAMMGSYSAIISPVLKIIYEAITDINNAQVYIDGMVNLLKMPEYHDIEKAKNLINLIENKDSLTNLLSEAKQDELSIVIGEENSITSSGDSSLIFKTFSLGDKVMGAIGVIGPKRMDYSKIIAKLEYFSKNMADIISNENDNDINIDDGDDDILEK
jgi:heat-inducible transcriptional repressor